jgi:hypothetical protein
MQVVLLGMDAKYRTDDVHHWIAAHKKTPRIRAVQGDGDLTDQRYKANTVYESRRAKKTDGKKTQYEGGLELWSIASTIYRRDLAGRFRAPADKPGAWLLPANVLETGKHYLQQCVNEPPTMVKAKDGRPKLVFKERDAHLGHDYWDCEVNGSCLADMLVDQLPGAPGWDSRKWARGDKPARPKAPKTAAAAARGRSAR